MTTEGERRDPNWQADWESNRRRKLVLGLDATPAQRLRWLEEALRIAHASGALARRRAHRWVSPGGSTGA